MGGEHAGDGGRQWPIPFDGEWHGFRRAATVEAGPVAGPAFYRLLLSPAPRFRNRRHRPPERL